MYAVYNIYKIYIDNIHYIYIYIVSIYALLNPMGLT